MFHRHPGRHVRPSCVSTAPGDWRDAIGRLRRRILVVKRARLSGRITTRLQELPKGHPLLVHLPQFNTLIKDYAAPLKALKTAMEVREAADVVVTTAKAAWRTAYDAIAGALRQMFPGRRSYQESVFLPESRPSTKKKTLEPVVPVV